MTNFIESHESSEPRPAKRRRGCIDLSEVTVDDIIKQYIRILAVTAVYRPKVKVVFRVPTIFCRDLEPAPVLSKS